MRVSTAKIGRKKTTPRAQARFCPVCASTKLARDFRQSNRNPRLSIVCWQCRHDNPGAERQLLEAPSARRRRLRRMNSIFRQKFSAVCRELRPKTKKKEAIQMVTTTAIKKQAVDLVRLPDRIAAIIGKSYAVRGDDATVEDDVALVMIRDLLDQLDPTLIERNKNKRLSPR